MLSPETRRVRTFATLRQTLTGSRQRPLIAAVEDLHWSDPTSEDWLTPLIESLANAPILLLVTYRPAYRPAWLVKPYATQMLLPPLTPRDSLRLVQSVLPQDRLSAPLVQAILARAAGHPFFLEELAPAIAEQGCLESDVIMPDTIRHSWRASINYQRRPDDSYRRRRSSTGPLRYACWKRSGKDRMASTQRSWSWSAGPCATNSEGPQNPPTS